MLLSWEPGFQGFHHPPALLSLGTWLRLVLKPQCPHLYHGMVPGPRTWSVGRLNKAAHVSVTKGTGS